MNQDPGFDWAAAFTVVGIVIYTTIAGAFIASGAVHGPEEGARWKRNVIIGAVMFLAGIGWLAGNDSR